MNKIALVTGGSRGLGREMARSLAKRSFDILLTYRNNGEMASEVAKELQDDFHVKAHALNLELAKMEQISQFIDRVKETLDRDFQGRKLDAIIHNAGMGNTVPFTDVTESMFDEFLNVHFKGVYFLTQRLLAITNDNASIVNISSGTTRMTNPGYSVYASMKGAIEIFTKYLAKELGPRGIRTNVVAPGPVETDFNNAAIRNNPQMKAILSNLSPLGRVGAPEDIGGVVAFLCSDEARWINGQRIEVSGGINI